MNKKTKHLNHVDYIYKYGHESLFVTQVFVWHHHLKSSWPPPASCYLVLGKPNGAGILTVHLNGCTFYTSLHVFVFPSAPAFRRPTRRLLRHHLRPALLESSGRAKVSRKVLGSSRSTHDRTECTSWRREGTESMMGNGPPLQLEAVVSLK